MSLIKEYNINLGLTDQDISEISDGRIKLHFLPNNNTDYDEKITISIGKVEDDAPLSECMDLVVGNFQDSEDLELGLTGLS
tara:strand:- start:15593 stop:15835 length:243 start_codon:yes stop_codon:yes gene_type:complete